MMVKAILAISDKLNKLTEITVFIMGIAMAFIMGAQVIFRYVFNHSLFWSEEVGRILLIWLCFLGSTISYKRNLHIGIDFFLRLMSEKSRKTIYVIVFIASMSFFTFMVVLGIKFIFFASFQKTAALGLPFAFTYSVIPLSGVFFIVHGLSHFFANLTKRAS